MDILSLPNEVLGEIVALAVQAAGLDEAMSLRLVCRRFDVVAQDCIYRSPRDILVSKRMSETMRIRLVQSKMRTENPNKLCHVIRLTANYLVERTSPGLYGRHVTSLARLAVRSMLYWNLVDCLSVAPDADMSFDKIKANALVAAVEEDDLQLVTEFLSENMRSTISTQYFGDVLATAASSGSLSLVLILLDNWDWHDTKRLPGVRYAHAVQAAAMTGNEDNVRTLMERARPLANSLYNNAIIQATRSCNASMLILLLTYRHHNLDLDMEKAFWVSLFRSAVAWNNIEVLQHLISKHVSRIDEASIELIIEDGYRKSSPHSVQMLLSVLKNFLAPETVSCAGGLFWAARSGTWEQVADILAHFQYERHQVIRALVGAVSGQRTSTIYHLLSIAGVRHMTQDLPTRLTDALQLMLPESLSVLKDRYPKTIESLVERICEASHSGDLIEVVEVVRVATTQHPTEDLGRLSQACFYAAKNNHIDVVMYLCENFRPRLATSSLGSTATAQIFIDYGWDINHYDTGSKYSRLGSFVHDEHFCRWFLENGASANAIGKVDITPTSVAVGQGSMSTIRLLLDYCDGVQRGQLLHLAVQRKKEDAVEVIELLLDLGCFIDSILFQNHPQSLMIWSRLGCGTPLRHAAQEGYTEVVDYLLHRGADPNKPGLEGETPLEAAEANQHDSTIALLKHYCKNEKVQNA